MVERALFLINASSATGHSNAAIGRLRAVAENSLGRRTDLQVQIVESHPQAKAQTNAFLAACDAPALIISGGGGGTLSAVIEGICEGCEPGSLPGPERVRVAALRMGSGNVLARQFGVPRNPVDGLNGIVHNLLIDRTAPCCVMRCEIDSLPEVRYAATLAGFGQFGRIPRDLAHWHRRLPRLHRLLAQRFGVERLTQIEYGLALFIRSAWCALYPKAAETVEVRKGDRARSMRLLAGAVVNFPFKALPFDPGVRADEAALSLNLIPYRGRWRSLFLLLSPRRLVSKELQIRIAEPDRVEIRLADRNVAGFFLDENPMRFHNKIRIQVAGTLAFLPGSDNL